MDQDEFNVLLQRSDAFQAHLTQVLERTNHNGNARLETIWPLIVIVHEHAASVRVLIEQNLGISALALMRVEFDAVVRQMWAGYCASSGQIELLSSVMSPERLEDSIRLPMTKEMLRDLEKDGPPALHRLLNEFITHSWKPLNSIIHTGVHALYVAKNGLPLPIASQMIQQSNNLLHISGYQIALLSQCLHTHEAIIAMAQDFKDCLQLQKLTI